MEAAGQRSSMSAMQLALEALEKVITAFGSGLTLQQNAITALRQALVDADDTSQERVDEKAKREQEPVAWMYVNKDGECEQIEYGPVLDDPDVTPLYTAPPKKQWVGLTDEEVSDAIDDVLEGGGWLDVSRALEAKLKEKNHG